MIDEEEVAGGIGIYIACEKIAHQLFDDKEKEKKWLQGCISPAALEYFRNHEVPNWIDNKMNLIFGQAKYKKSPHFFLLGLSTIEKLICWRRRVNASESSG